MINDKPFSYTSVAIQETFLITLEEKIFKRCLERYF